MSTQARVIETNLFDGEDPFSSLESAPQDLCYANRYSCQFVYDYPNQIPLDLDSSYQVLDKDDPDHPSQFLSYTNGGVTGQMVTLSTDDTLPAPLTAGDYYVVVVDADYFSLAASYDDAIDGIIIELDDAGVGTQTLTPEIITLSFKLQKSNSRNGPWFDVGSEIVVTEAGSTMVEKFNVSYRYVKAIKTISTSFTACKALFLAYGTGA